MRILRTGNVNRQSPIDPIADDMFEHNPGQECYPTQHEFVTIVIARILLCVLHLALGLQSWLPEHEHTLCGFFVVCLQPAERSHIGLDRSHLFEAKPFVKLKAGRSRFENHGHTSAIRLLAAPGQKHSAGTAPLIVWMGDKDVQCCVLD